MLDPDRLSLEIEELLQSLRIDYHVLGISFATLGALETVLKRFCKWLVKDNLDFVWFYVRWQIADFLFNTSTGRASLTSAASAILAAISRYYHDLVFLRPYAVGGFLASLAIFLPSLVSMLRTGRKLPLALVFANQEPFVISTRTRDRVTGVAGPNQTYVRVFPRCSDPIPNCEAMLLAAYVWENEAWTPILNEACPLTFANRGVGPLTVAPLVGPYVDVFYIEQGNDQLKPCIPDHMKPLRLEGKFFRLGIYRFDVQVDGSEPIHLRVAPGLAWNRPQVTVIDRS